MMKKVNKIIIALVIFLMSNNIFAQDSTSLSNAIFIALENNINIKISQNSVIITENLSSIGQAGLLPSLSASALADYGNNDSRLRQSGQTQIIEVAGAESNLYQASLNLDYTIFSGFGNMRTYDKLKANINVADADNKVFIENTILLVAANYYNVIRTEENYKALLESVEISNKRYELAKAKNEYSGGTQLDLLNVVVDLNKDSVTLFDAILAMENSRIAFNKALGVSLDTNISLINSFNSKNNYDFSELMQTMNEQNNSLLSLRYKEHVALLDHKISKSAYYPTLNLGSSYSYMRSENEASILDFNEANGFGINLSLSLPIYTGGKRKAAVDNAQVRMETASLQIDELKRKLAMDMLSAYKEYQNALRKVRMEKTNVETATKNFDLTIEKYKLGQIISTQFREAQYNLILAKNSYNNAEFNARLAELEIIKLSGLLLNEVK